MFNEIRQRAAPLLSLFIMLMSNGLYTTLISVRLDMEHASNWIIGLATSAYYAGFITGSIQIEPFISRVGHIRAFSIFATLTAIVSLLPGMIDNHGIWIVMRAIAGFSMAGIYIVIESWLLATSDQHNRGKLVAIYMIGLYGGQSLGQLLLNIGSPRHITQFCIASIIASLAIIPACITYRQSPEITPPEHMSFKQVYQISPTGIFTCFVSGIARMYTVILSCTVRRQMVHVGGSRITNCKEYFL